MVSAHWFIHATAVTAMARPRTIHDFYGFPDELFAFDYPAPGDADVAEEVADIAKPDWVGLDRDSWGIDHGTWSVLAHMFPEADVPVVQLSINALQPLDYHLELGARLAPLRRPGGPDRRQRQRRAQPRPLDFSRTAGFDWARRFDDAVRVAMTGRRAMYWVPRCAAEFRQSVPTPDHFVPVLYLAGLADAAGEPAEVLVEGYALGSLSMTSYTLGAAGLEVTSGPEPEPGLPDPSVVSPDETNL